MKQAKRPEVQIYRPGKGLQNRNSKIEDFSLKCDSKPSNVVKDISCDGALLGQLNTSDEYLNGKLNSSSDAGKASKNAKNRRPDIQVYTPKPKVAAQLNERKHDSQKNEPPNSPRVNESSSKLRKRSPSFRQKDSSVTFSKTQKDTQYKSSVKYSHHSNSASPITESWADMVEDSDLSNSRSSPDDKMCNGHSNTTNYSTVVKDEDQKNNKKRSNKSRHRSNKDDSGRRHRSRRNSHKNDSSHKESNDTSLTNKDYVSESKNLDDIKYASLPRSENNEKNKKKGDSSMKNIDDLSDSNLADLVKNVKIHNSGQGNSFDHANSQDHHPGRSNTLERKGKGDKKKRVDQTVPPRFQKNKTQQMDILSVSPSKYNSCSGGILKLPVEPSDSYVEPENTLYVPKLYQEPQVFIHKQLFDPNNPSKPEIVNIPAHLSSTQLPYPTLGNKFPVTDSTSPTYVPGPMQNLNYMPPNQPPVVNSQFCYMRPEMSLNNVPESYMGMRDVISPAHCPVPDARLNAVFNRSSICYRELSPISSEPVKKKLKPIVEKNLLDITLLERELSSLLSKGICEANLNALKQCRWKLQLRYENIILADPKYCAERNPEQSLWKTAFYQIIELLRKRLEDSLQTQKETKDILLNIILEGTIFYENLIEKQQETYGFNLEKLLEVEHITTAHIPETIRIVLISTQKLLIYLGDLARYKEQASQTTNYGKARSWYLKAQQIAPKNGRPYHQLAVLAFSTRRKLDAVYFYMRSLAASNPFLSAKESLLSLFEEAKRKYEQYEKKRKQETPEETEVLEKNADNRCEVWIKPDGSTGNRPAENDKTLDPYDLKNLSDVELNKRFVTSFLHVHGKLFTKVGMESFPEALNQMLKEFYFLLQRSPLPITSTRLLQLLAINIFSVDNSSLKEKGREHGGSSLLQEQALYTVMVMVSMLMERCHVLHVAHKSSTSDEIISDDLAQLLPSVKIWADWMSCHESLWPPPPSYLTEKLYAGFNKNVWAAFADLLTVLREIDLSAILIINERKDDCEPIILEEDVAFAGFVPLLGAIQDPAYGVLPFDKEKAKHYVRISRIQFFGDYLCGITPPCMKFDIECKRFVSLVGQLYSDENFERTTLHNSYDELLREDKINCDLDGTKALSDHESFELQALWSRKEALSKTKEQQEKYKAQVQAVLQKHQSQRPIVLKIKPRYLIPDTNCFINHLQLFRNILASSSFHLIIPLIVINELDGLARGTRVNEHTSPEHANRVTVLSREAIHFLEEQFAHRHPHLRAITSKGSVLDTISFRSEDMESNKGTNDDLILTCCLYYCNDRAENFMSKNRDEPITLLREIVLLTDDRNLRVKALAHHVPVRDLLSFLQWANS